MGLRVCAFLYRIGAVLVNSVHCTRASVSIAYKSSSPTVCDCRRSLYRFYHDTLEGQQLNGAPAKNGIFEPFIFKNDHFAKTGSGQT
jgi:hypothetical protein